MSKEDIIKTLAAKMEKIWIPIQIGKETDIMVDFTKSGSFLG